MEVTVCFHDRTAEDKAYKNAVVISLPSDSITNFLTEHSGFRPRVPL